MTRFVPQFGRFGIDIHRRRGMVAIRKDAIRIGQFNSRFAGSTGPLGRFLPNLAGALPDASPAFFLNSHFQTPLTH